MLHLALCFVTSLMHMQCTKLFWTVCPGEQVCSSCCAASSRLGVSFLVDCPDRPLYRCQELLCRFVQQLLCLCTQVGQKRPHTDATAAVQQLSDAFIDLMAGGQDSRRLVLTENGALTNASSGSAAVDFFFNVADTTNGQGARQFLEQVGI